MEDKRLDAVNSLMDGGVRFRLPAPFFLKWLKIRITIRAHKAGTILAFSKVVLANHLEEKIVANNIKGITESIEAMAECIAISALNSRYKIWWFKKIVKSYLLWQIDKNVLAELFLTVAKLNDASDFTSITKWYIQEAKLLLNPNLGQTENGR